MAKRRDWPDLVSGGALAAFAVAGLWLNGSNDLGTARRMGPGYLPMLTFLAMAGVGCIVFVLGLVRTARQLDAVSWRGMLTVLGAGAAFVALIESTGLAISILAATGIYSISTGENRPLRTLLLAVFLTAGCWFVFVFLLSIGIRLAPGLG